MRTQDECQEGSIPLVLTVTILVAGLVAALVSTVIGTQRSVTFDRQYTEAITVADAGLQQALVFLAQLDGTELPGTTYTEADIPTAAGDPALGAGEFAWTATKAGPLNWDVRSAGTVGDQTRVVEATIAADSDFFLAAFSDLGLTFRGGNGAVSYPPGIGAIGSNNAITMNGNSYADLISLFGPSASCTGTGCSTGTTDGFREELDMDAIRATVETRHAVCAGDYSAWTASVHGAAVFSENADGDLLIPAGTQICASEVDIDQNIVVTGGSQDNPVEFLVLDHLNSSNQIEFNCPDCTSASEPESGNVQIYSLGSGISIGNQNYFAAAILAPNASCSGGGNGSGTSGSNAQTDFFGSMVCEDLGNQGGWTFHFDADLLRLGSGRLDIVAYREETTSTTSFD